MLDILLSYSHVDNQQRGAEQMADSVFTTIVAVVDKWGAGQLVSV